MDGQVEQPLKWPDSQTRTRFQDRKNQAAWKLNYSDTLKALTKELARIKATNYLVTHNSNSSEDGGVAVWFTREAQDEFGWQEALGFIGQVPTVQEIDRAYMKLAQRIHPDGPTPNLTLFHELTKHRDNARSWARGTRTVAHDKVMAVDAFKEIRHNMNAIRMVFSALRQIERCGSPVMMDQAFRGFNKQITAGVGDATAA